jgi:hypothetical protein
MKPSRSFTLFLLLIFSLFLTATQACSVSPLAEFTVSPGGVLYEDKFGNPKSGWGEFNGEAGVAGYSDGAYHIYVKAPSVNLWAHPGVDFATVQVHVDAYAPAGPQDSRMGLICRFQDDQNFYFFVISADGYYGIGKVKAGRWSLLSGEQLQKHAAILTGQQINHLRADCIDKFLILYANEQLVGSAEDTDFANGDVGVLAGSFDVPGADVYFDNFVVYKP